MRYLRKFTNDIAYNSVRKVRPGVNLIKDSGNVIYDFFPKGFIDLGLTSGTLWSKYNVGSNTITGYGHYYMWGDIESADAKICDWSNYKYANGASRKLTKYCPTDKTDYWDGSGAPDNILTLVGSDDPATNTYGVNYHSPTSAQIEELISLPNNWTTINGVNGRAFCRADDPDVIAGDFSILEEDRLYLYDENYPNPNSDYGSFNLFNDISPEGLQYVSSKAELSAILTEYYADYYNYEGTVDVDTMLFLGEEHETHAIAGTDYQFGSFPSFNENTMLFFPTSGYRSGSLFYGIGSDVHIWSSSIYSLSPNLTSNIYFNASGVFLNLDYRYYGFVVRAVLG